MIKVRRAGIARIFKRPPFREWLDAQPRKALTYSDRLINQENGIGWTAEDFFQESQHRGLPMVHFFTVMAWCKGIKPRALRHVVEEKFKGVRF